jgi:hypothetical protein
MSALRFEISWRDDPFFTNTSQAPQIFRLCLFCDYRHCSFLGPAAVISAVASSLNSFTQDSAMPHGRAMQTLCNGFFAGLFRRSNRSPRGLLTLGEKWIVAP